MWRTAKRRFARHVCLRHPFRPLYFAIPSIHSLPEAWGPWERQHAPPALHYACIMLALCLQKIPSLRCSFRKKHLSHADKQKVWSFSCGLQDLLHTIQRLCPNMFYRILIVLSVVTCDCCKPMNNCWDWAFSNTGLVEVSLPAFQPPMFTKCDALPNGDLLGMFVQGIHSRYSFWEFQTSTPYQKQVFESRSTFHQVCIMVASCPSLRCSCRKKTCLMQGSRVVAELWFPRFVTMHWLCSQLCYVTAANQWTIVEIELLATVGWKCGCQPFSYRCSQNVRHCRKEICWTCFFKESIPAILCGNSKHPLPARSKFLRAAVRSTRSALWLHYACIMLAKDPIPSLQLQKKNLSHAGKQSGRGVVVSKICYNALIVLSVVLCDCCKPMNNCRDWAFSNTGLVEVWLPAFQLPMFAKCDTLPNGDLLDMFV